MKTRFAIIGLGFIGKRHAEMIVGNESCELIGLCDTDDTKKELAVKLDIPFFTSHTTMFTVLSNIDVVCVCTPNGCHALHCLDALTYNAHVVCEKPLGLNKTDCEQIVYKALHQNKRVFCVMQNRYSPPSEWLKKVVDSKIVGAIFHVQINCYWNRDDRYYKKGSWKGSLELDGGPLFTQFSHFIDIMYWLFGDIENIKATFINNNHTYTEFEDSGSVSFRFCEGGIGVLNYSTSVWDKNLESSITIIGENGSIKVGGQYMDKVEYCHIKNYEMPELKASNPPNDYGDYKGSAANHHYVFENVINTLNGLCAPTTNALEGLKVVDIIERIYSLK